MITMQFTGFPTGKKIENVKTRWSLNDITSGHIPSAVKQRNQAQNADTKLWPIIRGVYGNGDKIVNLVSVKGGSGYAEVIDKVSGETQLAYYNASTAKFSAAEANTSGAMSDYNIATRKGGVLLAAFMAAVYPSDGEMQGLFNVLQSYVGADDDADEWDDPLTCEMFGKALCSLSAGIYYRIERDVQVSRLRSSDLSKIEKEVNNVLFCYEGDLKMIKASAAPNAVIEELKKGEYSLDDKRVFTKEEKSKIPTISSNYVTPQWVRSCCNKIKASSRFEQPFRNVLLTGPSGTGKTTGAIAMAYGLGQPYAKITCGPDTDFFDLIGQMLPNTEKAEVSSLYKELDLPSFEDVENDFAGSYKKLFGKDAGKLAQPADCYTEILSRILGGIQTTKDFTYVESDFLKAIENGWLVEIQEPTVIKRNSVLVGLNSILETDPETASITLPTGKVIKRHPNTVVVMTTNSDYDGCGKIQQSVLSRMDIVMTIENPEIKEIVERTMKKTGFKDKALLTKMATVVQEINQFCREHDITDGVCGPRELKNWAQEAIITQLELDGTDRADENSVIKAMFSTLISKVSQSPEDIEDVITGVINKNFDQSEVQYAKEMYYIGL